MSVLGKIFGKIFGRDTDHQATSTGEKSATGAKPIPSGFDKTAGGAKSTTVQLDQADVEVILGKMAEAKGEPLNWRTSIVDLLKLLGLDSSLEARKELAAELGVNAGPHGSAEQNIALSKAVWRKLAENGGLVPDSLRD